ncbi:AbrB/MazE/SpoVT family DNA-binding domain-containing protein [Paenibacillus agilis]|uniref:AbrB/MazE/SpoVT family DNA-binding domain-containing protein n=1 Tax=Paenibacillus agilis TaxID=3020863 RepID=A0A559IZH1_9BACL|nr:AbrB/MazE/SpoVT family DNA-binding domain-containing protein [Paenibacillus agilis]TVX93013.1 AbrB/MazE/SpoVT family DNA-binding domain-containing protein [Paenibacillus agilis]
MKATGIVRRIDELGRVVIPKELRKTLDIKDGDPIEIFSSNNGVFLKKYKPGCTLCSSVDRPLKTLFPEQRICTACIGIIVRDQDKLLAGN